MWGCQEGLLHRAEEVKPKLEWWPQDASLPVLWDSCWGKLHLQSGSSPRERRCALQHERRRAEIPKPSRVQINPLCQTWSPKSWYVPLEFSLSFFWFFSWCAPTHFGMGEFTLCQCVLEVWNLFLDVPESQKKLYTYTFEHCVWLWWLSKLYWMHLHYEMVVETIRDKGW